MMATETHLIFEQATIDRQIANQMCPVQHQRAKCDKEFISHLLEVQRLVCLDNYNQLHHAVL
jgi:hypothetical protein